MAGRPASRGGGLTGVHYGLIAFVIVSVLSLGAFIWQLTQNSELQAAAERAEERADTFGDPRGSVYAAEATARQSSVFQVMSNYLDGYGNLVAGMPDASWPTVQEQAQQTLQQAIELHGTLLTPSDSLMGAVDKLAARLADEKLRNQDLVDERSELQEQLAACQANDAELRESYLAQVNALRQEFESEQQRYVSALDEKDEQRAQLQTQLDRLSQELQQAKVTLERGDQVKDEQLAQLRDLIEDLRRKIADIQDPGLDPEAILTKADGKIIRAIPGSDYVYINLGSQAGIKVGMGFEIFSQVEAPTGVRGKASVEVASVTPQTAECRITRSTPGKPVIEGDYVVNLAYERNRKPRFVILGEFDLDYDGQVDLGGGRDKVAGIIEQWGGQVVSDLDETTDFVVVGTAPVVPDLPDDEPVTPVIVEQVEQRQLARSEFTDIIDRARSMYIPVITQSQFLFLTGYSGEAYVTQY